MNWLSVGIIVLVILVLRFLLYFNKLNRVRKLRKLYLEYLQKPNEEMAMYKQEIITLFNEAGLHDFSVFRLDPAGYGQLRKTTASGFQNILVIEHDVVNVAQIKFKEAEGVYKKKMLDTIQSVLLDRRIL